MWVPGFGVNDFAFRFIKKFMREEFEQGYAVLFYNLPFHLDRMPEGSEKGEGLITGNVVKNLDNLHALSQELHMGCCFLESIGVERIGAWSASIGSSAVGVLAATREFDHMSMMIPIVDWNTLIFGPFLQDVREEIMGAYCSEGRLRRAYRLVSPVAYELKTPPERVFLQYAEYDQLTPAAAVEEYAKKRELGNITGYSESHATILLNSSVYRDYGRFLYELSERDPNTVKSLMKQLKESGMSRGLGWRPRGEAILSLSSCLQMVPTWRCPSRYGESPKGLYGTSRPAEKRR